ncbi:hypothetical protein TSUD_217820 [Trifolium subterraneum]|uniref:Uncharacterized protein n=1 Tax=Trifolium subterraneum TaxID=3900 RepID=A0A2Z6NUI3_TRISU|nr:hypothetical protein TSUD_217820 [Trifolium subterraneum]
MAANSLRAGSSYGGAVPFRSSDGLSTRPGAASEEIQLRIDPMDLDNELTALHRQVTRLKNVAEEIGTEMKYQKDFLEQLCTFGLKCPENETYEFTASYLVEILKAPFDDSYDT